VHAVLQRYPVAAILGFAAIAACGEDGLSQLPETGSVEGYLCQPAGQELAAGAGVSASGPAGRLETRCDEQGFFRLDGLPAGEQVLVVEGNGYRFEMAVSIVADETTRLPAPSCLQPHTGDIAGRVCASGAVSAPSIQTLPSAPTPISTPHPGMRCQLFAAGSQR